MSKKPADVFRDLWDSWNVGLDPTPEYRFHPVRRWRLDFAWPELKLGVEIQGGIFQRGRTGHSSGIGMHEDHEKLNEAQALGWVVLQVNPKHLGTDEARDALLDLILRAASLQRARANSLEVIHVVDEGLVQGIASTGETGRCRDLSGFDPGRDIPEQREGLPWRLNDRSLLVRVDWRTRPSSSRRPFLLPPRYTRHSVFEE